MNKYVVAFWSDHTGELKMEQVEADNAHLAVTSYLGIDPEDFPTMDSVHEFMTNSDGAIEVLQIDKKNWKNFSSGGPVHAAMH